MSRSVSNESICRPNAFLRTVTNRGCVAHRYDHDHERTEANRSERGITRTRDSQAQRTAARCGKAASAAGFVWREKWSAIARAAVAEQLTLDRTPR